MRPRRQLWAVFVLAVSSQLSANQAKRALESSNVKLETSGHMLELNTPAQYVKGIGPRLAEVVATKGITTVEDLLYYLPFRYEDRLNPRRIGELRPGEMASVIAEVRTSALFRTKKMPLFELTVGDPTSPRETPHPISPPHSASGQAPPGEIRVGQPGGETRVGQPSGLFGAGPRAMLKCVWFNGTYLKDRFQPGQLVALYGKVEPSKRGRERLQLINPQFEILDDGDTPESIAESTEIGGSCRFTNRRAAAR